jgi:hypothetical protein
MNPLVIAIVIILSFLSGDEPKDQIWGIELNMDVHRWMSSINLD